MSVLQLFGDLKRGLVHAETCFYTDHHQIERVGESFFDGVLAPADGHGQVLIGGHISQHEAGDHGEYEVVRLPGGAAGDGHHQYTEYDDADGARALEIAGRVRMTVAGPDQTLLEPRQ